VLIYIFSTFVFSIFFSLPVIIVVDDGSICLLDMSKLFTLQPSLAAIYSLGEKETPF